MVSKAQLQALMAESRILRETSADLIKESRQLIEAAKRIQRK